jgi:hypothetical protein
MKTEDTGDSGRVRGPNLIIMAHPNQYDIENVYTYHAPKPEQNESYVAIREKAKELASLIGEKCPTGRELEVARTKLEESVMWANSAIARS